jgi:hypothetical protein
LQDEKETLQFCQIPRKLNDGKSLRFKEHLSTSEFAASISGFGDQLIATHFQHDYL